MTTGRDLVRVLVTGAIRGYQRFVSPAFPRRCKYYPTCSQYAIDAVSRYGVVRGVALAGWRLLRCNPLSYGGYDPVERQRVFPLRGAAHRCAAGASSGTGGA